VNYEIANAWYAVPTSLAITAPCATTITAVDLFLLPQWSGMTRQLTLMPAWREKHSPTGPRSPRAPAGRGVRGNGQCHLAGTPRLASPRDWGPIPVESWLLAGALYPLFIAAARRMASLLAVLGFPQGAAADGSLGAEPVGRLQAESESETVA
jgi:hypothetical protein